MDVQADLLLTRFTGKKCYTQRERHREAVPAAYGMITWKPRGLGEIRTFSLLSGGDWLIMILRRVAALRQSGARSASEIVIIGGTER